MTSTAVYLNNYSAMDDGIAITSTGYLSPRNGLSALEPGATYDSRFGMASLDVQQQHCLEMNIFAHGLLGDVVSEHYQIPFTPNPPQPVAVDLSCFNRNVQIPHDPPRTNSHGDADYKFGAVDHSIPAGGSFSVFPGTQNPIHAHLPRAAYVNGSTAASDAGFFARKHTENTPSPRFNGANPTAFPDFFPGASSLGVRPAQPSTSTFPQYPPSCSSTPSALRGLAYEESKREPSRPISHNQHSALSSTEPLERPAAYPGPPKDCCSVDASVRTLRSVRTRFGDVYAEHELCTDRVGGRWVCQCGSTFARDSDWERHAMHSLSHSAGGGFDCNICDISFTRSDAMFRHRRKKHGDPKPNTLGSREREDERSRLSRDRQLQMRFPGPTPKSRGHGV
ncbi:hypothetical protein BC827DRAFT_967078 [Russula dissimulans]|nr:hypothetical protein BC827DRAFT_967078 [Russula dissimulans]